VIGDEEERRRLSAIPGWDALSDHDKQEVRAFLRDVDAKRKKSREQMEPLPHCHYCLTRDRVERRATLLVHDKRGCLPCCTKHAEWREGTSRMLGHDPGCLDQAATSHQTVIRR
jgi:hypothetical protein